MHELSIAAAVLELARREVPPACVLTGVNVVAGPMRAIEPEAMQFAWTAILTDAKLSDVRLELRTNDWSLQCPSCGARWMSSDLNSTCACGKARGFPIGGDELQLVSIDVDECKQENSHARLSCTKRDETQ